MKRGERGFFTLELIVTIGISALITLGAGMTIAQMISSNKRNDDHLMALNNAQKAGYWISNDVLMSQNITLGDEGEFISLAWKDWETGYTHNIRYLWLDSEGSLHKLSRNFVSRDTGGTVTDNRTTLVADYISSANITQETKIWRLDIQTQYGEKTVSREYEVRQRQ